MAAGSVLGLTAKLGVETDEQQVKRETNSLKDKITEAAEAEMEADVGSLKSDIVKAIEDASSEASWMPDIDTGNTTGASHGPIDRQRLGKRMEALGQNMPNIDPANSTIEGPGNRGSGADRDGSLMGEALGGMKGAGGKFLKVGLAGAVGAGILSKVTGLADSAPRMEKVLGQISRAINLFARPFFDVIAKALEPYAQTALSAMAKFNDVFAEEGLMVAIASTGKDMVTKNGQAGTGETIGRILGLAGGVAGGAWAGAKAGGAAGGAIGSVVPGAGTAAGAAVGAGVGAVGGGLAGLLAGGAVGDFAGDFIGAIKKKSLSVWDWIKTESKSVWDWTKTNAKSVWEWTKTKSRSVWDWTRTETKSVWDWTRTSTRSVWNWTKTKSRSVWDWTTREAKSVWDWTKTQSKSVWDWTKTQSKSVWDWTRTTSKSVWDWITTGTKSVWDWTWTNTKSVWDWISTETKSIWNWITDGGGSSSSSSSSSGSGASRTNRRSSGDTDYNHPRSSAARNNRRAMATGGLVTRPTEALVGEAGPEVVAPFGDFMQAVNSPERRFGSAAGGSGSGGAGSAKADEIVSALNDLKREVKKLGGSGDVYLDGRRVGEVQRESNDRYERSRVVTR